MSVLGLPWLCAREGSYHRALRRWVDELNAEVLEPRGLFAKFQTNAVHSKDYHEEISWLAVALSEEEAQALRAEPIFWTPACCADRIKPDPCACRAVTCCCCVQRVV
jgi:hypothetical protein